GALRPLPRVPRAAAALPARGAGGLHRVDLLLLRRRGHRLRAVRAGAGRPPRGDELRVEQRARRRHHDLPQAVRVHRPRRDRTLLALPDLGVPPAGPLRPRAEDDARVRGDRGSAVPLRRGTRLLHPAEGAGDPHRAEPRGRHQHPGLRGVPPVLHPDAPRLRPRLQHPGVRGPAQHRRGGQRQGAGRAPTVDRDRHLRLRRRGDALGRPVHDDLHGSADGAALRHLRGHRALQRPQARRPEAVRRALSRPALPAL
ncbi:MAG: Twin-arginine translocation protein TatC, partial [uncultured Nocardioides sp.]